MTGKECFTGKGWAQAEAASDSPVRQPEVCGSGEWRWYELVARRFSKEYLTSSKEYLTSSKEE